MTIEGRTLVAAERTVGILARAGAPSALIGAVALAVHGYPRSTEDLDLAIAVDPSRLDDIALHDAVPYRPGASLRVVTIPHLVLFKLYAGGPKSKNDVLELLKTCRSIDAAGSRAPRAEARGSEIKKQQRG